jgi:transcriptional regulator GlxA family with amidase domain
MQFVMGDLSIRHSRASVARAASVEPTYFSKLFQDVVGVNFRLWNMAIRVQAAQTLLFTTDRQVRDIAAAVGYTDLTTFERVFRKVAGTSPTAYREARRSAIALNAEKRTQNAESRTLNAEGLTRLVP